MLAGGGAGKRWFVIKGAKNREAAEQLIRYMHSADVQKEMFKISNGYVYPAYEWGWDEPEIKASDAGTHVTDVWKQYLTHQSGYTGGGSYPAQPSPVGRSRWSRPTSGPTCSARCSAASRRPTPSRARHDRAVRVFKEFGAKGE